MSPEWNLLSVQIKWSLFLLKQNILFPSPPPSPPSLLTYSKRGVGVAPPRAFERDFCEWIVGGRRAKFSARGHQNKPRLPAAAFPYTYAALPPGRKQVEAQPRKVKSVSHRLLIAQLVCVWVLSVCLSAATTELHWSPTPITAPFSLVPSGRSRAAEEWLVKKSHPPHPSQAQPSPPQPSAPPCTHPRPVRRRSPSSYWDEWAEGAGLQPSRIVKLQTAVRRRDDSCSDSGANGRDAAKTRRPRDQETIAAFHRFACTPKLKSWKQQSANTFTLLASDVITYDVMAGYSVIGRKEQSTNTSFLYLIRFFISLYLSISLFLTTFFLL